MKQRITPTVEPGIPGSFIDPAAASIRWVRNHLMENTVNDSAPGRLSPKRVYLADVADGTLRAFTSRDPEECGGRFRLSVVHWGRECEYFRLPTWDEFKSARYILVPREICMAFVLPAAANPADYVDAMPWCLQCAEIDPEAFL